MLVLLLKIITLVIIAILVRSALPRYRIDQVLSLNWKFFIYTFIACYVWLIILFILIN